MSEIIVLGLIPGTQIQITFLLWLLALGSVAAYITARYTHRKRLLRNWVITTSIILMTRRPAL